MRRGAWCASVDATLLSKARLELRALCERALLRCCFRDFRPFRPAARSSSPHRRPGFAATSDDINTQTRDQDERKKSLIRQQPDRGRTWATRCAAPPLHKSGPQAAAAGCCSSPSRNAFEFTSCAERTQAHTRTSLRSRCSMKGKEGQAQRSTEGEGSATRLKERITFPGWAGAGYPSLVDRVWRGLQQLLITEG